MPKTDKLQAPKITSCTQCKTKCCYFGPAPRKKLSPAQYLANFGTTDAWRTQCREFKKDVSCGIWGTEKFPNECRTFVCNTRMFSKKELEAIDQVEDQPCWYCNAKWTRNLGYKGGLWHWYCEICKKSWTWKRKRSA